MYFTLKISKYLPLKWVSIFCLRKKLEFMEVKITQSQKEIHGDSKLKWVKVTQSCPTLCDPMD